MSSTLTFTAAERLLLLHSYRRLLRATDGISVDNRRWIRQCITTAAAEGAYNEHKQGINPIVRNLLTANILTQETDLDHNALFALLLYQAVTAKYVDINEVTERFGEDIRTILRGLTKANSLYATQSTLRNENYSKLLLTFAEDVRVIMIMIADRLCLMRMLNRHENETFRNEVAFEVSYLYTPLAHRLGLYSIKSELEDLTLKYTQRTLYDDIAKQLSETKRSREIYIDEFIAPLEAKLKESPYPHYEIKGRTKSIYSIANKMRKQQITDIGDIYDLFAIRIILETPIEQEKAACWHIYSIVTDMYQPNPRRMKDWLSIPKSNGYESLHITVMGRENHWVEVQIRTRRMDEIAERGLAAHWKYKGGKSEAGLDEWLNNVRETLEEGPRQEFDAIKEFKMELFDKEVFAFTPKGDLHKLSKGATILDFAFAIHTNVGSRCVGAKANGRNVPLRHIINSGDTIDILTSSSQTPKKDWLNIVTTSRARTKIKQALNEALKKEAEWGKELLQRRFKNRKMEMDETLLMRLIKKSGYKTVTDFFADLAAEKIEITRLIDSYADLQRQETRESTDPRTADNFVEQRIIEKNDDDVLVIDTNVRGVEYKLSKCCNPIYGDPVFGFISMQGSIKIHRNNCPNALQMHSRFGYRIVKAQWSGGKQGSQYTTSLHIIGHDDIGIVTNITSIISKEAGVSMRSISVNSHDGLFEGNISVAVSDIAMLEKLIKKIRTVKGVKNIERLGQ